MKNFINLINNAISDGTFIKCAFSNPRKNDGFKKITAAYVTINDALYIQFTMFKDNKAFHENIDLENMSSFINSHCVGFKQIQFFTTLHDYHILVNKKGEATIKAKPPTQKLPIAISHNRQKSYILDTPSSAPFLKALDIMDANEKIKPSKYDKYKQINRYLEIVSDVLEALPNDPIRIVDFGCGKSYLTFALYHYLNTILGRKAMVIGLDLKEDVITFCNDLAKKLRYNDLIFQVGDIGHYTTDQQIDMVVSLHACNTATDSALEKAIGWQSKVILAVPCCHHEAYTQIQNDNLEPILKYGLLKERIAALMTDGLRANILEIIGYKVDVIEFIDMVHTPKNILLRAVLKTSASFDTLSYTKYQNLCDTLNLDLSLARLLNLPSDHLI
ncbi:class I SAM-dependent methyltransferase [Cellulosilyticum sp. I15G10I2]|uniref:class I SAM-dependent methyltransferase n=1 Tax=Cellulosilyticum sp. I15G10I2 TaxID=1892843 RepID=UPI00085CA61A|nr:SAM-dependent methyltransferase [Cellulosilyticum sp. I15G10I2]